MPGMREGAREDRREGPLPDRGRSDQREGREARQGNLQMPRLQQEGQQGLLPAVRGGLSGQPADAVAGRLPRLPQVRAGRPVPPPGEAFPSHARDPAEQAMHGRLDGHGRGEALAGIREDAGRPAGHADEGDTRGRDDADSVEKGRSHAEKELRVRLRVELLRREADPRIRVQRNPRDRPRIELPGGFRGMGRMRRLRRIRQAPEIEAEGKAPEVLGPRQEEVRRHRQGPAAEGEAEIRRVRDHVGDGPPLRDRGEGPRIQTVREGAHRRQGTRGGAHNRPDKGPRFRHGGQEGKRPRRRAELRQEGMGRPAAVPFGTVPGAFEQPRGTVRQALRRRQEDVPDVRKRGGRQAHGQAVLDNPDRGHQRARPVPVPRIRHRERRAEADRGHPAVFEGPRNPLISAITGFDRQAQNGPISIRGC